MPVISARFILIFLSRKGGGASSGEPGNLLLHPPASHSAIERALSKAPTPAQEENPCYTAEKFCLIPHRQFRFPMSTDAEYDWNLENVCAIPYKLAEKCRQE